MKKLILLLVCVCLMPSLNAQDREVQIQKTGKRHSVKTLKFTPENKLNIGRLLTNEDSLKVYNYFEGSFLGGDQDSLYLRLIEVRTVQEFSNGIRHQSTFPAPYYQKILPGNSNRIKIAIKDIDYLKIKRSDRDVAGNVVKPLIFVSLATLILSPLISYNFKEGELNTERYTYWALGSTVGLVAGFGCVIVINAVEGPKTFQFKADWPNKKAHVWKFTNTAIN